MRLNLRLGLVGVFIAALATCAVPTLGQNANLPNSQSGNLGGANAVVTLTPVSNGGTCAADISGTWSGTITFQVIGQSNSAQSATAYTWSSATGSTTTTSNGMYYWPSSAANSCQVKMTSYSSGTAAVTVSVSAGTAALPPAAASGSSNATIVAPTDAGGNVKVVQPAPSATQQVGCDTAAHCPVNASQVTSPWTVSTPSSAPAPTATAGAAVPGNAPNIFDYPSCVHVNGTSTPAPTSGNAINIQCDDIGRLWVNTTDPTMKYVASSSISSATTTLLVAGANNKRLYIYQSAWQSNGTNASNTVNWEYGQGATCGTNTQTLLPAPVAPGTATGEWVIGWAGGVQTNATQVGGMPGPAAWPLILPLNSTGYGWCGVTAGTTTAGVFVTVYGIHDN